MNVLIFHMRYFPDKTGTAPLVTQLAQDLVSQGNKVTVIASLPHYGRTSIHPDYQKHKGFFSQNQESGVHLIRTPVFVPRSPLLLPRAVNYLSYNILSIIAGFLVKEVDVVLAINPPITTTFSAWLISVFRRSPLVVGIQDVWPDCVIQIGQLQNRIVVLFSKLLEKIQYQIARKIIVLSPGMKKNLVEKGVIPEKIEIIANWADIEAVHPLEKDNPFYRDQGWEDYFVVLFSGNHGYIAALDNIIDTALLLKGYPKILFVLAGEGSVKKDLLIRAKEEGLENIRFLSTQPPREWLEMLAAADLGLVTLRKELAGLNVPSKVYTLMAAELPILASVPEESEVASLVQRAHAGIVVAPESPAELSNAILEYHDKEELLKEFGRNGRRYLVDKYNRKIQTNQYLKVLKSSLIKDLHCETFN